MYPVGSHSRWRAWLPSPDLRAGRPFLCESPTEKATAKEDLGLPIANLNSKTSGTTACLLGMRPRGDELVANIIECGAGCVKAAIGVAMWIG